jgi:hypothetical protein
MATSDRGERQGGGTDGAVLSKLTTSRPAPAGLSGIDTHQNTPGSVIVTVVVFGIALMRRALARNSCAMKEAAEGRGAAMWPRRRTS